MDDRFSARRGTYRVIYRIDDKARMHVPGMLHWEFCERRDGIPCPA